MLSAIGIIAGVYFFGFMLWLAYNTGKGAAEYRNKKEIVDKVFTEAYRQGYEQAVRDELTIHEHNLN